MYDVIVEYCTIKLIFSLDRGWSITYRKWKQKWAALLPKGDIENGIHYILLSNEKYVYDVIGEGCTIKLIFSLDRGWSITYRNWKQN